MTRGAEILLDDMLESISRIERYDMVREVATAIDEGYERVDLDASGRGLVEASSRPRSRGSGGSSASFGARPR